MYVVVDPIHPLEDELAHVALREFGSPFAVGVREVHFEDGIVDAVLLVLAQRNWDGLGVVSPVANALRDIGEGEQLTEVFALVFQPLAEVIVHASHVREGGHDCVVDAASLDLLEDLLLVLNRVATQLANGALPDRIVENEKVKVAQSFPFVHANGFYVR